jgi:hypothetical protein
MSLVLWIPAIAYVLTWVSPTQGQMSVVDDYPVIGQSYNGLLMEMWRYEARANLSTKPTKPTTSRSCYHIGPYQRHTTVYCMHL